MSTPCPSLSGSSGFTPNAAAFANDENTANVEFTAKFPGRNSCVQPRRRPSTLSGQCQDTFPADRSVKSSLSASILLRDASTGNKVLEDRLQAPRRMRPPPAFVKSQAKPFGETKKESTSLYESERRYHDDSALRKNPRRRTIYIPSDDTTVMTIHPGSRAADTNTDDTIRDAGHSAVIGDMKEPNRRSNAKRRTSLTVGPRRAPLQPSLKPVQENTDGTDRVGANWDKENIPPGLSMANNLKMAGQSTLKAKRWSIQRSEIGNERQDITQVFPFREENHQKDFNKGFCSLRSTQTRTAASSRPHSAETSHVRQPSYPKRRNSVCQGLSRNVPREKGDVAIGGSSNGSSLLQHQAVHGRKRYKVLQENIETPEMFEDAWLSNSELAVQQLLNRIFERNNGRSDNSDSRPQDLRHELLQMYTASETVLLYRRLQASLSYGALNPPNTSPFAKSNWASDLGLRRRYTSLLLDTYDSGILKVATEVVVGRSQEPCLSLDSSSVSGGKGCSSMQKVLKIFMEDCLVDNQDAYENPDQRSPLWCWRRTMLRSLMLVLLLDKAKENGLIPAPLFKPSSALKNSHEVLLSLLGLLSPFTGHRQLAQLNYRLEHIQPWPMEYVYEVKNLAIDMRDGVKLTRLVEILLHSRRQPLTSGRNSVEAEVGRRCDVTSWALSEQLRMPCHCSTQKISNVQMALNALRDECSIAIRLDDIRAEDIVHGHREKTITLLWTLVSKLGLDKIIDFQLLKCEIRRLNNRRSVFNAILVQDQVQEKVDCGIDPDKKVTMLKEWAAAVALYRGEKVCNFTTAFSDGHVFNAIVDEYSKYVPGKCNSEVRVQNRSLAAKLKDVGCSNAFALIFENNGGGRIFDEDFVLAALAFLCSRLVIPARRGIAASVIGNAYKRMRLRRSVHQRLVLMRLAYGCKSVFEARNRIIDSVKILQRAWRTYQEVKRTRRIVYCSEAPGKLRKRGLNSARQHTTEHVDIWLP